MIFGKVRESKISRPTTNQPYSSPSILPWLLSFQRSASQSDWTWDTLKSFWKHQHVCPNALTHPYGQCDFHWSAVRPEHQSFKKHLSSFLINCWESDLELVTSFYLSSLSLRQFTLMELPIPHKHYQLLWKVQNLTVLNRRQGANTDLG